MSCTWDRATYPNWNGVRTCTSVRSPVTFRRSAPIWRFARCFQMGALSKSHSSPKNRFSKRQDYPRATPTGTDDFFQDLSAPETALVGLSCDDLLPAKSGWKLQPTRGSTRSRTRMTSLARPAPGSDHRYMATVVE